MKNFYVDAEFNEGFTKPLFGLGKKRHFIDLISIAMVCEDGRKLYEISKDFDLSAAWYKWQFKQVSGDMRNAYPKGIHEYWLRDNVLKPIYVDLINRVEADMLLDEHELPTFTLKGMRQLLSIYGKTNNEIAKDILTFVQGNPKFSSFADQPRFYAYYADYDWVVLCSLFGTMMDLPNGWPMFCHDLQQTFDELVTDIPQYDEKGIEIPRTRLFELLLKHPKYPKQTGEHNALSDALWNAAFHKFLIHLKQPTL